MKEKKIKRKMPSPHKITQTFRTSFCTRKKVEGSIPKNIYTF